jgi:hypothetical protein
MNMEITESTKIQWADYVPAVSSEPLNTYYQRQNAQSYSATGYSFVIKSPSLNAFMDPEIYIRFKFQLVDIHQNDVYGMYHDSTFNALASLGPGAAHISDHAQHDDDQGGVAAQISRFCFRGGNIFQRATQQIAVTVNGWTLSYEPWKWIDPLNRLYVSNSQSRHIFSGSGGSLDSGNHGNLSGIDNYYFGSRQIDGAFQNVTIAPTGAPVQWSNIKFRLKIYDCLNFPLPYADTTVAANIIAVANADTGISSQVGVLNNSEIGTADVDACGINAMKKFPPDAKFYNPGLTDRQYWMYKWIRGELRGATQSGPDVAVDYNIDYSNNLLFHGYDAGGNLTRYAFEIYEPIPCPLFKMYHNDGVAGIIPHIRDLQIVATFSPNMLSNILRTNYNNAGAVGVALDWTGITTSDCEILIKWYTPPMNLSIPREISLPLRKIDLYLGGNLQIGAINSHTIKAASTTVSQYNISIDAVPDLFMIFVRRRLDSIESYEPDDFYFMIENLVIQLENNGGKTTQIHTYQMYQNWLKYAKHRDPVEMDYDEWRRYCCVALLKPEDYGVIRGPGYDNYIVLGITCNTYNMYNNPRMNTQTVSEFFQCNNNDCELVVVSIFDRWAITFSDLGQAKAGLTRIRENNPPSLPGGVIPA